AARAIYAAPVLLATFTVVALIEPAAAEPLRLFPALFALLAFLAWRAIAEDQFPVYFVAAFFGVVAEASWSAAHLDTDHLRAGILIYAAFAVFYLVVPLVSRRIGRPPQPAWGPRAVLIGALCVVLF